MLLADLKLMDDEKHKIYTGVSNTTILDNIRTISDMGHLYWIRIPLIQGVNADEANVNETARFLASLKTAPEIIKKQDRESPLNTCF